MPETAVRQDTFLRGVWRPWRLSPSAAVVWSVAAVAAGGAGFVMPADWAIVGLALALLVVGGLLAAVPLLQAPLGGLGLLLVVAVIAPVPMSVGGTRLDLSLPLAILLGGAWAVRVMMAGTRALERSPVTAAVLALMVVSVLSFVAGQAPSFAAASSPMRAQLGGLALFVVSGAICLMAAQVLRRAQGLQRLTRLFLVLAAMVVVIVIAADLLPGTVVSDVATGVVAPATLGSMFWTWTVAMALSQAVFNRDLSVAVRLGLASLAGVTLARGLLLAFSWMSGWLPPAIAAATVLAIRFPRAAAFGGLLVLAPAAYWGEPMLNALLTGERYSWLTRAEALNVMWTIIRQSPVIGFGPANYYHYTELYPLLGWYVPFSSHNQYVDLAAQAGMLGLFAFLAIVALAGTAIVGCYRRTPGGFGRAYLAGATGGLVGSVCAGGLADWIIPFVYNLGIAGFRSSVLFWVFLGGAIALTQRSSTPMTRFADR